MKLSRRPFPVGATPIRARVQSVLQVADQTPFSIRTLRLVGVCVLQALGLARGVPSIEACDKVVRVASRIAPNRAAAKTMKRGYRKYRKIYPALRRALK